MTKCSSSAMRIRVSVPTRLSEARGSAFRHLDKCNGMLAGQHAKQAEQRGEGRSRRFDANQRVCTSDDQSHQQRRDGGHDYVSPNAANISGRNPPEMSELRHVVHGIS